MASIDTQDDIAAGIAHLSAIDPRLSAIVNEAGPVPLRRSQPGFASLAEIVISQQVSKQSAAAITLRIRNLIDPLTAEAFLAAGEPVWREAGLSRPKQHSLSAISQAVADGALDLDALCRQAPDDAIAALTRLKGIGPWTAEVYLLFAAGHRDIFPAGDLALQAAAARLTGLETRPDEKQLRAIAESWAPWRGVAARLLWAWYGKTIRRTVLP